MGNGKVAGLGELLILPRVSAGRVDLAGNAAVTCLLLALTWGKWPDILSDSGRELYIPWQLASGQALYRDLAYLNGPLSPYYHALLFKLGGVSFLTQVSSNILILLLTSGLIHHIIREMADRSTAQAAVLTFLLLFGFGHLDNVGNFNFLSPYSHELTHGLLLTLGLLVLLVRYRDHGKFVSLVLPGFLYGLIFLTKVEIFVAATAMVSAWLVWLRRTGRFQALVVFLPAALLPVAVAAGLLATRMEVSTALLGLSGGWGHLLTTPVAGQFFYQKMAGLDKPLQNVRLILASTFSVMLLIVAAAGYDYSRHRNSCHWLAAGLGLCLMAALWLKSPFPLLLAGPELPAVALVGFTLAVRACRQGTTRDATRQTDYLPLTPGLCYFLLWSVLAGALLLRFGIRPTLAGYGFVLVMPAALLFIVLCLYHAPRQLAARYGGGRIFRRLALGGLAVSVGFWVVLSGSCYLGKTVPAGHGADTIMTYSDRWEPLKAGLAQAVKYISQHTAPGSTLVSLPEGVMVNYLTRRPNPTPYVSYMPAELAIAGEEVMLAALQRGRPDYVLVIARKLEEYGYKRYSLDEFSRSILEWVKREYVVVDQFGFFVTLYKRR